MAKLSMDDPFFLAKALKWYKRRDVQEAILQSCEEREVAPRYGQGFGKRPDQLLYPADILEFAKRKATSFHCSEERWRNVQQIKTGATRKEQDELRTGWDLVLDIDCPYWYFAKLTTALFIKALQDHKVRSITTKFSGGKGFHIGVPFEAFPKQVNNQETKDLFPEAPRAIALYLLDYIGTKLIQVKENTIIFDRQYKISYEKLKETTGKEAKELIRETCTKCATPKEARTEKYLFLCSSCGHSIQKREYVDYLICDRCGGAMEGEQATATDACATCQGTEFAPKFNVAALIEVDTVLIASRHLFRTPYSLHEKSGLVSVVFPPEQVMNFEKEYAKPELITGFPKFLEREVQVQGAELLIKALELSAERESSGERKEFSIPEEAIPEELFPPCMQNILKGLKDGKKRSMFALTNFLKCCGWGNEQIAARLEEWNKLHPEPLREVMLKGHMRTVKMKKEAIPPANCKRFYQDIQVCQPDNFCRFIKNPAQYARRKAENLAQGKAPGGGRKKLTEEQKAMRKAYRERQREQQHG